MNPIIIIAALAAGAYFIAAKAFKDEVDFKVSKIRFDNEQSKKYWYTTLFFDVTAVLSNPTKFGIQVNSIDADVLFQNKKVATVSKSQSFAIKPETNITIESKLQVNALTVFTSALQAFETLKGLPQFTVVGSVHLNSGTLIINEKIKLTA